jgi:hypothetical protein
MNVEANGRNMRATHLLAGSFALALSVDASAQSVGGSYAVSGVNINGSAYSGSAQIAPSGSSCRITWRTGSTNSSGICMLANRSFAASYRLGSDSGMAIYELHADGSLHGWWTIVGREGVGTETLTPRH